MSIAFALSLAMSVGCGFRIRVIEPDAPAAAVRGGAPRLANRAVCDVAAIDVPYELGLDFDTGRVDALRLQSRKRWQVALEGTRRFGAVPTTGAGESREATLRDSEVSSSCAPP